MTYEITEITDEIEFDAMEEQWTKHIANVQHLSFFTTWKWLNLWWHTFAQPSDQLKILLIKESNRLIAIFPLYLNRKQHLMFVGQGEPEADEVSTEYIDILAKELPNNIIAIISNYIVKHITFKTIEFRRYLATSLLHKVLIYMSKYCYVHTVTSGMQYCAQLSGDFPQTLRSFNPSLVKRLYRFKRKAENALDMKFIEYNQCKKITLGFDILEHLHQMRWQSKGKKGVFSSQLFKHFHLQFIEYAAKKKWLQLNSLTLNNQHVAAIYCINYGDTCFFYQSGVDTNYKPNVSPGYLLHLLQMEKSIQLKLSNYDFMLGTLRGSYKEKLSNKHVEMLSSTLLTKSLKNSFFMLGLRLKNIKNNE